MIFTDKDMENFNKADKCLFCNKDLIFDKVRDHDHLNGKYRGLFFINKLCICKANRCCA